MSGKEGSENVFLHIAKADPGLLCRGFVPYEEVSVEHRVRST